MSYLTNHWYAAGASHELAPGRLLHRRLCGEDIVLFRGEDGVAGALEDRCPHRMAPLSLGEVVGDRLQCGYHGAEFDRQGRCVHIPCQPDTRPAGLQPYRARAYAVVEAHAHLFVWWGDPAQADPALLPHWSAYTGEGWALVHGYHHVAAHQALLLDNLNDLTHLSYVHKATLGKVAGPSWTEAPVAVRTEGRRVHTARVMRDQPPSTFVRAIRGLGGDVRIDRFQTSEFSPPSFVAVVLGAEPHEDGCAAMRTPTHVVLNAVTPEDERHSHYFWCVTRHEACADEAVSRLLHEVTAAAFDEDQAMIEAQQRRIDTAPPGRVLMNFSRDGAVVATRRLIARQFDEQRPPPA